MARLSRKACVEYAPGCVATAFPATFVREDYVSRLVCGWSVGEPAPVAWLQSLASAVV